MGSRVFKNIDEAAEFMDSEFIGTEQVRRANEAIIEQARQRIGQIMAGHYGDTEQRVTSDIDFAVRVRREGEGRVDEILEELSDGSITAREAATKLAAARSDLNRVRKLVDELPAIEQRAWSAVNKSEGEYMRDVAKRFPALVSGQRNQIVLTTND